VVLENAAQLPGKFISNLSLQRIGVFNHSAEQSFCHFFLSEMRFYWQNDLTAE